MKSQTKPRPSFRVGPYVVDGRAELVKRDGKRIPLSGVEFDVLYQLVERRGELVLRREFKPWEREGAVDQRNPVDMAVVQIRKQLEDSIIETERGKGYRLGHALTVELIASPSSSELERLLAITLNQINEHSSASFKSAIDHCKELLMAERIPDAYAVLGLAYINQGHVGFCREQPSVAIAKAREIINEALEYFPTFGSAYALRGLATLIYDYDWRTAEADFRKALEGSPENELAHCFLAHLLVAQGKFGEGLEHARIAAELDYESAMTVATEPWLMMFAERGGEAVARGEEVAKRFAPSAPTHAILGDIYQAVGTMHKAIEQYRLCLDIEFLPAALASLGYVQARMGHREEALNSLAAIYKAKETGRIVYVSGYFDALVHAGLGESKKSLDALERAYDEKCDWLVHLGVEPRWKELRREKRFVNLMRRVGIKNSPIV